MDPETGSRYISFLFPAHFRKAGYLFCVAGIVAAYLIYALDVKPDFLDIKVFAVFSYYFRKKYMSVVNNNISEEILMVLFIGGLFLISFSKFKNETLLTLSIRMKALFISFYINTIIVLIAVLFTFGLGFIAFAVILCLVAYEIFEITLTYLAWDLFFPESIKDQFTDIFMGFTGSIAGLFLVLNFKKLKDRFPGTTEASFIVFISLTFAFLWLVFSHTSVCLSYSTGTLRNLIIFSMWLTFGYLTIYLFKRNRVTGSVRPWFYYTVSSALASILNFILVSHSGHSSDSLMNSFPGWLYSIRFKLLLFPVLPAILTNSFRLFTKLVEKSASGYVVAGIKVFRQKKMFLIADASIIFIILTGISLYQDLADKILIAFWFMIALYTLLLKRYGSFIHLVISTIIAFTWVFFARNNYDYNHAYLSIGGMNLLPVMSWALGMMGILELISYLNFRSRIVRFVNYLFVFWILLLLIETYAYHVINIRDISSGNSTGLPFCDCVHAPCWMRIAYFLLGPFYFLITSFVEKNMNRLFQCKVKSIMSLL